MHGEGIEPRSLKIILHRLRVFILSRFAVGCQALPVAGILRAIKGAQFVAAAILEPAKL
jgi:hypothetical protein